MKVQERSRSAVRFAVALALAGCGSQMAWAADEPAVGGLEEVTVSATRRVDTNLQETPVSVSAVTAGDIDRMVAKDISGIAASVPGFSAARVTAFNAASFAMRGVGITDIIVYQDSPVGVTVDDFVMPSVQTQLLDTFDIASAEVLRGPQGTLFGKNTTGGAVNIKTKRPNMSEFGADIRLGFAKFGEKNAQGSLDLPIVADKFAVRVAGSYIKTDGYYKLGACWQPIATFGPAIPGITGTSGCGTGEDAGGQDVKNARIKAQWNITENLTALLQYEYMRDRSDAVPSYNDTPVGGPYLWNALGFSQTPGDPLDHMASSNRTDQLIQMNKGQKIDVDGAYLNVDWKLNDSFTIYSNTGFRHQEEHLPNTYTGAAPVFQSGPNAGKPLSLFDASRDTKRDTFQQEVRIASTLSGPFNYVVGGFFQRNDASFCVVQYLGFVDLTLDGAAIFGNQTFFNDNPKLGCNRSKSQSIAAYADVTWNATDKLQFGAGFRQTRDEKSWEGRTQVFWFQLKPTPFPLSDLRNPLDAVDFAKYPGGLIVNDKTPGFGNLKTTWTEPSWRVNASYKITDDVFTYATVSRGYKAGGYNDQTGTSGALDPAQTRPVNPEFATNFEVGLKSQFFDNRLRFNPTVFYVKYSGAQRAQNVDAVANGQPFQETVFFNAAKVTSKGVELEVQAKPIEPLMLRAALSYLDAKYDEFRVVQPQIGNPVLGDPNGNGIIGFDRTFTGLAVPRSPKKSGSLSATWTADLANAGTLAIGGELSYEDKNLYYTSIAGRQFDAYLNSKTLTNASLTWTSANGQYFGRLYGRNLGDKRYRIASQSVGLLWTHTQWGEPLNFGVQFGAKFGSAGSR